MDLSYILNSPDVERVATALETIAQGYLAALTDKADVEDVEALETRVDTAEGDIDALETSVSGKVAIAQGATNAGKALIVGETGAVGLGEASVPVAVSSALLELFKHVAYIDDASAYYDALEEALIGIVPMPDLSVAVQVEHYFYNADGDETSDIGVSGYDTYYLEREYFAVKPSTQYVWIMGKRMPVHNTYSDINEQLGNGYRVLYYDKNKTYIYRDVIGPDTTFPPTFTFTTPANAAFIRLSWNGYGIGEMAYSLPDDMYRLSIALAKSDNSTISDISAVTSKFTIERNGEPVDIGVDFKLCIFNFGGGQEVCDMEPTPVDLTTTTRVSCTKTILVRAGDVLKFDGINYGLTLVKMDDETDKTYTSAWVTSGADYVIGG